MCLCGTTIPTHVQYNKNENGLKQVDNKLVFLKLKYPPISVRLLHVIWRHLHVFSCNRLALLLRSGVSELILLSMRTATAATEAESLAISLSVKWADNGKRDAIENQIEEE